MLGRIKRMLLTFLLILEFGDSQRKVFQELFNFPKVYNRNSIRVNYSLLLFPKIYLKISSLCGLGELLP